MCCKKCGQDRFIVNKHFSLCGICNSERLSNNKPTHKVEKIKRGGVKINKMQVNINADENFYLECFNLSNHECEECGAPLPNEFRDSNGKVNARWRYSHILSKSIYPELRHNVKNINHLCLKHHTQWDHGDKKNMKIYELNKLKFPNLIK
jgi:hypothetical protein